MPLAFTVAGLAVLVLVALLAVGRLGADPQAPSDLAPLDLPETGELTRADVVAVRFAVGLRGYRMDQVDLVLDRLAAEVAAKDARIAALQQRLGPVAELEDAGADRTYAQSDLPPEPPAPVPGPGTGA